MTRPTGTKLHEDLTKWNHIVYLVALYIYYVFLCCMVTVYVTCMLIQLCNSNDQSGLRKDGRFRISGSISSDSIFWRTAIVFNHMYLFPQAILSRNFIPITVTTKVASCHEGHFYNYQLRILFKRYPYFPFHWHNPSGRNMAPGVGVGSASDRNDYQEYLWISLGREIKAVGS